MAVLNIYNLAGDQTGTVEVKDSVFGIEPNKAVLHEEIGRASCRERVYVLV